MAAHLFRMVHLEMVVSIIVYFLKVRFAIGIVIVNHLLKGLFVMKHIFWNGWYVLCRCIYFVKVRYVMIHFVDVHL